MKVTLKLRRKNLATSSNWLNEKRTVLNLMDRLEMKCKVLHIKSPENLIQCEFKSPNNLLITTISNPSIKIVEMKTWEEDP